MKFPSINNKGGSGVTVPKLSGGMNLRDGENLIADDQLTECKNMWFKDGVLKTRPGLYTDDTMKSEGTAVFADSVYGKPLDIYKEDSGGNSCRLFYYEIAGQQHNMSDGLDLCVRQGFYWCGENEITALPPIPYSVSFCTQYKNKLYAFLKNETIYTYDIDNSYSQWDKVTDEDMYVPLAATHCKPEYMSDATNITALVRGGAAAVDGINLLGGYYRMIYSTVNRDLKYDTAPSGKKGHLMMYQLLNTKTNALAGKTATAVITNKNGLKYTHTVVLDSNSFSYEKTSPGDGLYMGVTGGMIFFSNSANSMQYTVVTEDDYIPDNLEITFPYEGDKSKVFSMNRSVWFGGAAAGISGGTRLFLCGGDDKSLVIWSGLNDPLYFPENCYAYVGDSAQKVTCFGKQSDMLVIFKENEIFYTSYKKDDVSASELISGAITEYSASAVYFPMIQLHSSIGCDSPDTVQLCRNRLVWANSDGNVYTLINENQYNERTVLRLSDMIKRRLAAETGSKSLQACDYDGHYMLFAGSHIYVMDYESYGYVYAASYSKCEDAQRRIPWWYWELPEQPGIYNSYAFSGAFTLNSKLFTVLFDAGGYFGSHRLCRFDDDTEYDITNEKKRIHSVFKTKSFDFGIPSYKKRISAVNISFGNNNAVPIEVTAVTDEGEAGETVTLNESGGDKFSTGFIHNRQLHPHTQPIVCMALRAECDGIMVVNALSINYKLLGGAR